MSLNIHEKGIYNSLTEVHTCVPFIWSLIRSPTKIPFFIDRKKFNIGLLKEINRRKVLDVLFLNLMSFLEVR